MIVVVGGVIVLFILLKYLSRNPPRRISAYDDIVSPADGKIMEILPFDHADRITIERTVSKVIAHSEHVATKGYLITIVTPWNAVHYHRSPLKGSIHGFKTVMGKSFSAKDPEAILTNTRNEMIIKGKIKIKLVRIAGKLSTIKSFIKPGQEVSKGKRIGYVSFASQTVLILPNTINLKVKAGDTVIAGETSLADYYTVTPKKEGVLG